MLRILLMMGLAAVVVFSPVPSIRASEATKESVAPNTNKGEKWRIGYVEAGPYQNYPTILKQMLDGLAEMGWLEKGSYPQTLGERDTRTLWSWLGSNVRSDYLDFVADAYWSAGWDEEVRKKNKDAIISRLNNEKDIDLMLAFGTKAGLDMANDMHYVPTMVLSVSDPIQAGIVKSADDSGFDHIHARVDPGRYERQIRLFHQIIKFKKLGVVYENSPSGGSYAAIADLRKVAADKGFELLECHSLSPDYSVARREDSVVSCCEELAPQVDAFYITVQVGVSKNSLPRMLAPFFKYKVATFSQGSTNEVKHGVLMSLAQENFKPLGKFHARTFARILNGAKPRDLPMVFEDIQEIAINLETAKRIGFRVPLDVLAGAKEIYESIEKAPEAN